MANLKVLTFIVLQVCAVLSNPAVLDDDIRIVGGQDAKEAQFPYQISMRTPKNFHFCGGSIIGDRWALTAAHCTAGRSPQNTLIVVGTITTGSTGDLYQLSKIIAHESYDPSKIRNDIALLKTAIPIQFNQFVQKIAINGQFIPKGRTAIASGWGLTSNPGESPSVLQYLPVLTLSNAECWSKHRPVNSNFIYRTSLCTFTRRNEGLCMGDSGGPLAVDNQLVGVVSWGIPCASGSPDVFTRVSEFATWITAKTSTVY